MEKTADFVVLRWLVEIGPVLVVVHEHRGQRALGGVLRVQRHGLQHGA